MVPLIAWGLGATFLGGSALGAYAVSKAGDVKQAARSLENAMYFTGIAVCLYQYNK
jgi:hypothetical protein